MAITIDDLKPYGFKAILFLDMAKGGWSQVRHSEALDIVWTSNRKHRRAPVEQVYNWRGQAFTDTNELIHAMNQQGFELPQEHPDG